MVGGALRSSLAAPLTPMSSYQVLARKWRPQTFDEVTGQTHVTTPLRNAIRSGRIPHAILLTGPRGTGKTTLARIFASCLNAEKGPTDTPDPEEGGGAVTIDAEHSVGAMEDFEVGTTFKATEPVDFSLMYRDHPNYPVKEDWSIFQNGMIAFARLSVHEVVAKAAVPRGARRLLDLGGGHGLYGAELARAHGGLHAVVFDDPAAEPAARRTIAELELADRVEFRGGDFWHDDIGTGFDVVFLGNVVHGYLPDENPKLFEIVRQALRPPLTRSSPARSRHVSTACNPDARSSARHAGPCSQPCSSSSVPPRWRQRAPSTTMRRMAASPSRPATSASRGS